MSNCVRMILGCTLFATASFADMMSSVAGYIRSGVSESEVGSVDLPPYLIPSKNDKNKMIEVPRPPMRHIPLIGKAKQDEAGSPVCEVDVSFIADDGSVMGIKMKGGMEGADDKAALPYALDLQFSDDGLKRIRMIKTAYFEALDEISKSVIYRVSVSKHEQGRIAKIAIGYVLHPDPQMLKMSDRVCEFSPPAPPVEELKAVAEELKLPPEGVSTPAAPVKKPTPKKNVRTRRKAR